MVTYDRIALHPPARAPAPPPAAAMPTCVVSGVNAADIRCPRVRLESTQSYVQYPGRGSECFDAESWPDQRTKQ
jgi:hypothetical protein